jgi:sulfur carrier protein
VQIFVNGEEQAIDPTSLLDYLEAQAIDPRRVAVELNLEIIPKAAYATTVLGEGDRLEIVQFVGGGSRNGSFSPWRCQSSSLLVRRSAATPPRILSISLPGQKIPRFYDHT